MSQTTDGVSLREEVVPVADGRLRIRVSVAGEGPPLVYLHPAGGPGWDPFLDRLSETHTVYAPDHPGTSPDDPHAIHAVETWLELVLAYEELLRGLGVERPVVVGQSYGGMLAAELGAIFPGAVSRLVLLDPIGLWRDDAPIPLVELCAAGPEELPGFLFRDPQGEAARAAFTPPSDPEEAVKAIAAQVWALGCTAKFFWPVADHGLSRRLHRVTAQTLIVWGRDDALVPLVYAGEFADRIADSRVAIIEEAGHIPQLEQTAATLAVVEEFLGVR